ncbi:allatostatin-A receptor-like [Patiria miniata]|uniref:G-protein coupled receptors family 1 profile domain-containing protein n=1 Tax=Patiria miniata TaxID=46514 RepID=A0A913Z069_PATMI|nr:allatostatin-A receptor-like [Patiria miniata]
MTVPDEETLTSFVAFRYINMNKSSSFSEAEETGYDIRIVAAIIITVAILGTIGNSFVIIVVALSKKLRTTTNVFVVNLAVADVLTCLFLPWQAVAIVGGDDWPIPRARFACTAASFVILVTIGCSMNNLALIAINRWVGITKSRSTTRRIYTARKLALMVIVSWAIPLGCALTPVLTDFGELGYEKLYNLCIWTSQETIEATRGNTSTRLRISKRQVDVTKNCAYVVLAFIFCYTPCFVAITISDLEWIYKVAPWAVATMFCNSSVNPVIYATSHPDFKEVIGHLMCRQRCRTIPQSDPSPRARAAVYAISSPANQECPENEDHRM